MRFWRKSDECTENKTFNGNAPFIQTRHFCESTRIGILWFVPIKLNKCLLLAILLVAYRIWNVAYLTLLLSKHSKMYLLYLSAENETKKIPGYQLHECTAKGRLRTIFIQCDPPSGHENLVVLTRWSKIHIPDLWWTGKSLEGKSLSETRRRNNFESYKMLQSEILQISSSRAMCSICSCTLSN